MMIAENSNEKLINYCNARISILVISKIFLLINKIYSRLVNGGKIECDGNGFVPRTIIHESRRVDLCFSLNLPASSSSAAGDRAQSNANLVDRRGDTGIRQREHVVLIFRISL